jgi:hypothetical protein
MDNEVIIPDSLCAIEQARRRWTGDAQSSRLGEARRRVAGLFAFV